MPIHAKYHVLILSRSRLCSQEGPHQQIGRQGRQLAKQKERQAKKQEYEAIAWKIEEPLMEYC